MLKFNKRVLILSSSITWVLVGIMLLARIPAWYNVLTPSEFYLSASIGLILAVIKVRYVFMGTVIRNINRINKLKGESHHILLFHSFKFYLMILPMIGGGIFLRTSDFIPKYYVLPIYLGVGLALVYSGMKFLITPHKTLK